MNRYSVSQFVKAMATAETNAEQAQAMEQINVDFVDMINQIRSTSWEDGVVPDVAIKTVDDVKLVVAKCAMQLRVWLARINELENEE